MEESRNRIDQQEIQPFELLKLDQRFKSYENSTTVFQFFPLPAGNMKKKTLENQL